jgi:hypothetical protein
MYCVDSSSLRFSGQENTKLWEYLKVEVAAKGTNSSNLNIVPYILETNLAADDFGTGLQTKLTKPYPKGINILPTK